MVLNNHQEAGRAVIIHGHMFKNAGSTFDWALNKNFGSCFVDHRDDAALLKGGGRYLPDFLIENPRVKAFSSHHLYGTYPSEVELENVKILPVYFLRHPVERIFSVYHFEKSQQSTSLGATNAKKMGFKEYVRWRMRPDVPTTIRDFHSRYCAGYRRLDDLDDVVYNNALTSVQDALCGIVERFDESMVLIEEGLKPFFPDIDLSYLHQNVNKKIKLDLDERIEKVQSLLGDGYDEVLNKNAYDLQLYRASSELLEARINAVENFEHKLESFKYRCENLKQQVF